jgi:hypothetical protein
MMDTLESGSSLGTVMMSKGCGVIALENSTMSLEEEA